RLTLVRASLGSRASRDSGALMGNVSIASGFGRARALLGNRDSPGGREAHGGEALPAGAGGHAQEVAGGGRIAVLLDGEVAAVQLREAASERQGEAEIAGREVVDGERGRLPVAAHPPAAAGHLDDELARAV